MTDIRFEVITEKSRSVVENLWQPYAHDLSKYRGTRVGLDGKFGLGRLPLLFTSKDRIGYFFYQDEDLVGFAIVRGLDVEPRIMSEFFILGALQNKGLGKEIALRLFDLHPGAWEIPFQEVNAPATAFWRKVAELAAPSKWREEKRPVPDKPQIPADNWISFTVN